MFVAIVSVPALIALHVFGFIFYFVWLIFGCGVARTPPAPPRKLNYVEEWHAARQAEIDYQNSPLARRNEAYAAYVASTPWWKRVFP
jgi:hypothetical protein